MRPILLALLTPATRSLSYFFWGLCALTLALTLTVKGGYSYPTASLFFLALGFLFPLRRHALPLTKADLTLLMVFVLYGLSSVGFVYLDGWNTRDLDSPLRFLLVLPIIFLLLRTNYPNQPILFYGANIGAIGGLIMALYNVVIEGKARAGGYHNEIMFGDTSMMFGLISAASALYFYQAKHKFWLAISILAVVSGVIGSFLSGSRGGWVAIPLIGFFILYQARDLFPRKLLIGISTAVITTLAVSVILPQTGVQHRIQLALQEVQDYVQEGKYNTSVGLRLDMWQSTFYLFKEAPLLGVGKRGGQNAKAELVKQGQMSPEAADFGHLHNEFLNTLAINGVIGLAFLLSLYLIPLRLFLAKMRQSPDNWKVKSHAMAGALVPMSFMDFALTQSMFSHNLGIMMFIFPMVFFWCATRWLESTSP